MIHRPGKFVTQLLLRGNPSRREEKEKEKKKRRERRRRRGEGEERSHSNYFLMAGSRS